MPMGGPQFGRKEGLRSLRKGTGFALVASFTTISIISGRVFVVSDIKTERIMIELPEH
jgi:hypothetical protein